MDKYEYKLRSEEILKLIEEENYTVAADIADTIDWRRVKSISMLLRVAALYRVNRRNEDSRAVLLLAYDRYPTNRSVVYSLCEVSIELDDVVAAIEYYKEFVKLAPRDNGVYTLRYRILEAQEANLEERIGVLEELKKRDYQEEWAYELAYLYHRVGLGTKCVEECDDLILWFGDGPYVTKAMELKMLHAPLTSIQQKKYDLVQMQLRGEETEEEQPQYEEQEVYAEDTSYSQEQYAEAEAFYGQETYPEEEQYVQESYPEEVQYVYADDDNKEYAVFTEPVQKQTTGSLDMSQYNTINLQKVVAESMRELFPDDDEDVFAKEWTEVSFEDVLAADEASEPEDTVRENAEEEPVQEITETEESEETEAIEELEADVDESATGKKADAVPVPVPVQTHTDRIAAMVAGVSERAPEPNTGAISKVILPGEDARVMKQDTDMEELRNVTEENVREEQDRLEEEHENVYEEPLVVMQEEAEQVEPSEPEFSPMTGQMNIDEVLNEWERMKQEIAQKRQEEVKQNVLRQTGKLFDDFDEAVKSGILGELVDEEMPEPVRTETFLEVDETEEVFMETESIEEETYFEADDVEIEELEEIEEASEYTEIEETEEASEYTGIEETEEITEYAEPEEVAVEQVSVIEEVIAKELGGRTVDIPQDELEEALQEAEEQTGKVTYEALEELNATIRAAGQEAAIESDIMKTQEISMNTEEISSLPEKIIEATKRETKAFKREEIREFTSEEKERFENYAVTRKIKKQIIYALDTMSLAAYTGNVLITGEPGLGTVDLAKNLVREFQAMDANFSGKVAKITGEKLNLRELKEVFDKLKNGAIIIEQANGLTEDTLYQLAGLLNQEEHGIIVIMEDTRKEITKLLEKQAMIADYFNIRIDLLEMDNNALVAYAKNYALALEYSIDELGTLALYTRIANSQSGNHVVTKDEVREIVDEAIYKSRKFKIKNFVDVLFSKRYDSEDMIVLKERDFI